VTKQVLLVEPFLGGSHQQWATGWRANSRHSIEIIGHAGDSWRWRMRGGSVSLARQAAEIVAREGIPDVVMSTDMLDLASFAGISRGWSGGVALVHYLHENQLTYPRQPGEPVDVGLAWMTWRSLVTADEIWCNSTFHREALRGALDSFVHEVPDESHEDELRQVGTKLVTMPVGVDSLRLIARSSGPANRRPLVISNQRWHHDKDLGSVLRALVKASEAGHQFDVALLGDDTGGEAETLAPLVERLGDRVIARGHLPRPDYEDMLARADVVVSAARNEFFGIAVVEAVAAGAWPVLPNSLAYPEIIESPFHQLSLYEPGGLGVLLRSALTKAAAGERPPSALSESMARFDWSIVAAAYDDRIDELSAART